MKSRRFRQSRKAKKARKSRRGGMPTGMVQYTVSGMEADTRYPLQFNASNITIASMGMLRNMFINEVNGHKYPEPADYDTLNEDVEIHLIRGNNDSVIFSGKMKDWTNNEMFTFIQSMNDGDKLRIELIIQA